MWDITKWAIHNECFFIMIHDFCKYFDDDFINRLKFGMNDFCRVNPAILYVFVFSLHLKLEQVNSCEKM